MGERVLRGSRLGAVSYETDRNTDLAPRQVVEYRCPKGHAVRVPFAAEADVPETWECRYCGATAGRVGAETPAPKQAKPSRTHMDMLRERRSDADLEEVLKEQLEIRSRRRGDSGKKSA